MRLHPNLKRLIHKAIAQPLYALKVLKSRAAARMHYLSADGKAGDPESVTLFLTYRCNLHCKMCGQWGEGGVTKKKSSQTVHSELPPEAARSLVDELAGSRPGITLFGGEPLLYDGFIDLVRYIKSKKMHCLVITNGYLLDTMAGDIVESSLDELNVSLDGPGELHDSIRGMPGLFNKIMGGLKEVNRIKGAKNRKKPLINLQCTITRYNYERLDEMIAVAQDAGADSLTFHNLIFTDKGVLDKQKKYDDILHCSSADWEGFVFEPGIDPKLLYEKMGRILAGRYDFSVDFYPNFSRNALEGYYRDPCFMPAEYPARCLSPWIVAYVFPDGTVRPCLNCTYSFGNIKEGAFRAVWNSEKAAAFRRTLRENRIFPACSRCTELYRY